MQTLSSLINLLIQKLYCLQLQSCSTIYLLTDVTIHRQTFTTTVLYINCTLSKIQSVNNNINTKIHFSSGNVSTVKPYPVYLHNFYNLVRFYNKRNINAKMSQLNRISALHLEIQKVYYILMTRFIGEVTVGSSFYCLIPQQHCIHIFEEDKLIYV